MKHFWKKFAALLVAALLPFAAYFVWIQRMPAAFGASIMGGIHEKLRLLEETPGPRLLLAGGSSVPYSLLCQPLSEAAGMPCINLGATAYLGMDYYLSMLRGALHEGDIVVIAPEFTMYSGEPSYSVVWMAVENDLAALAQVPLLYWPGMLQSYHIYAADKQDQLRLKGAPTGTVQEQFAQYGYAPWGDLPTGHAANILEQKYNTEDVQFVDETSADASVLRALRRFGAYAERQGATVYLTYAPFNRLALASSPEELDAFQARVERETGLPFLGEMRDGILPEDLFYDSNNHLTEVGQSLRTQGLAEDLFGADGLR